MSKPAGSIVIVTFNSAAHIEPCLQSLAQPGWERIVVDNASFDDTVARAQKTTGTKVVANQENRGFAAAANQGAYAGQGPLLLFLNPDVTADPGALEALARAAQPPEIAAVGGRLLNSDGSTQAGFVVRRLPTLLTALAEVLLLNRLLPGNPWNRRYRCLGMNLDIPALIEQPAGACLLVKRWAWETLGGFDERFYPLWYEDVDFCRRLRSRGWGIAYQPEAHFRHAGGHSLASMQPGKQQLYWYQNLLRYFRKHHGRASVAALRLGILVGMVLRILATALGFPSQREARRASVRDYARIIGCCVFAANSK